LNKVLLDQSILLKRRILEDNNREDEGFRVGVEVEACLLDDKALPVNASPLIKELSSIYNVSSEYGACQFELITNPISIQNFSNINSYFEEFLDFLVLKIKKTYKNNNVIPVFLGGNPSPFIFTKKFITESYRYQKIYEIQKKRADIQIEGQKYKARDIATAIQGFHIHLQGKNPVHTANMFNYILNLIPTIILLGSSSKLFAGKLFSLYSPRIYLYQHSEPNNGFPTILHYLNKLEDHVDYITSKSNIDTKDYFELEKNSHDDLRIRLNSDFYRVETRLVSGQPTFKEMVAIVEFLIGFLYKAMEEQKPLRPISFVRDERNAVIHSGYAAKTQVDVLETAESQISTAKKGLSDLGLGSQFKIIEARFENKSSPSVYVKRLWESNYNGNVTKTVSEIIQHVWERTRENKPLL
jgi:hypothetical protein